MHMNRWRAAQTLLAAALVTSCTIQNPTTPSPEPSLTPQGTASPTPSLTPTLVPPVEVPLAVVTGFTNLKAVTTVAEAHAARGAGTLIQACDVVAGVDPAPRCLPAADITA